MLQKDYRLRKNWQFQETIKQGRKFFSNNFVVFSKKNCLNSCRFGISIPKKTVKKAFQRNYYKRQIRNMIINFSKSDFSCSKHSFHKDIAIVINKNYLNSDFATNQVILHNVLTLIHKTKIKYETKNLKKNY